MIESHFYKNVWIDTSGVYSPEKYIVAFLPDCERYFKNIQAAKRFINDKRAMRRIKRKIKINNKKFGVYF